MVHLFPRDWYRMLGKSNSNSIPISPPRPLSSPGLFQKAGATNDWESSPKVVSGDTGVNPWENTSTEKIDTEKGSTSPAAVPEKGGKWAAGSSGKGGKWGAAPGADGAGKKGGRYNYKGGNTQYEKKNYYEKKDWGKNNQGSGSDYYAPKDGNQDYYGANAKGGQKKGKGKGKMWGSQPVEEEWVDEEG